MATLKPPVLKNFCIFANPIIEKEKIMISLDKLRKRSGLVIAAIGFALLAFLLGDLMNSGTSLLNGARNSIRSVKNRYNRLIAYPAHHIHAPTDLFGEDFYTGRMTLTFFMHKDWTWD